MLTRRAFLRSAAACVTGSIWHSSAAAATDTPITGAAVPELAPFDKLMTAFIADHQVPGAALAIARHSKLVYSRGFGFADVVKKTPVQPAARFRIASISKPLTAVAVLQLAERKKIQLDAPVLKYIDLVPHLESGAHYDPRWEKVTVRLCLQHRGGWDRDRSFDPIAVPGRIARSLKIMPPVTPENIIRYMLGRRLDFDPGERYAYSNFGYLLLGRAIAAASDQKYQAYVRKQVLAPLGITTARLGRALPENRFANEVTYYDPKKRTAPCLYPPRVGEQVPLPDGAFNFEAYQAHGGWVASAIDLVRFASAFDDPKRCPVLTAASIRTMWARPRGRAGYDASGEPLDAYYGCGWNVRPTGAEGKANTWHSGLITGTSTLLVRRHDGLNWAVLFNADRNAKGKVLSGIIDPLLHRTAAEVRRWPA